MTMHYYIIARVYCGPNSDEDRYTDADTIGLSTRPATTNMSHEVRIHGWCGTTNDWAVYAHGEYPTLEDANSAVKEIFGEVRDCDPNGDPFGSDDEDVVKVYKPGRFAPMGPQWTAAWAWEGIKADIEADTTDARIDELVAEYEVEANGEGYTLDGSLQKMMRDRRQELLDEAKP